MSPFDLAQWAGIIFGVAAAYGLFALAVWLKGGYRDRWRIAGHAVLTLGFMTAFIAAQADNATRLGMAAMFVAIGIGLCAARAFAAWRERREFASFERAVRGLREDAYEEGRQQAMQDAPPDEENMHRRLQEAYAAGRRDERQQGARAPMAEAEVLPPRPRRALPGWGGAEEPR